MNALGQQVQKTTKQAAVNVAKRIAQEQLETLKNVREQVATPERSTNIESEISQKPPETVQADNYADLKAKSDSDAKRLLENLEAEIAQIRARKKQIEENKKQTEQNTAVSTPSEFVAPVGRKSGKIRSAFGAMKKKLSNLGSKAEKQRSVSG
jgi:hypothetical protein